MNRQVNQMATTTTTVLWSFNPGWMNEWMMFLLTCDKKLTKSQLSPTHASTKRKITDELK